MSFVQIMLIASGVVGGLALLLAVVGRAGKLRVPAIVTGTTAGLGAGVALGMMLMAAVGDPFHQPPPDGEVILPPLPQSSGGGPVPAMMPGMGGGGGGPATKGGGPAAKGGGGGGGGGRGPSAKVQLATLVTKLDQLSQKPLVVELNADQKAKVRALLAGLEEKKELSQDDAKKCLDDLLDAVKDHRPTLEAAGYRWPGAPGGGFRPPQDVPNPFQDGENLDHLKALRDGASEKKS